MNYQWGVQHHHGKTDHYVTEHDTETDAQFHLEHNLFCTVSNGQCYVVRREITKWEASSSLPPSLPQYGDAYLDLTVPYESHGEVQGKGRATHVFDGEEWVHLQPGEVYVLLSEEEQRRKECLLPDDHGWQSGRTVARMGDE